jgi:hypothetical protein
MILVEETIFRMFRIMIRVPESPKPSDVCITTFSSRVEHVKPVTLLKNSPIE